MKSVHCSLLLLVAVSLRSASAANSIANTIRQIPGANETVEKLTALVHEHGCDPNICFALDGSGSISWKDWQRQRDFVEIVAGTISSDPEGTYSAVQYGLGLRSISRATSNIEHFLYKVDAARRLKSSATFIAPGLGYCMRQFRRYKFRGEPKKIVLLGDGRSNFDSKAPPLDPASIVRRWLKQSDTHSVCAVAVHFSDVKPWAKIVGGADHVFKVAEWLDLLIVMEDLVIDICGWRDLEF